MSEKNTTRGVKIEITIRKKDKYYIFDDTDFGIHCRNRSRNLH